MEKDDELFEGGYGAEFWEYDARLGRRFNLDPVVKAWESGYSTFSNNPIYYIDPSGEDPSGPSDKGAFYPTQDGKAPDNTPFYPTPDGSYPGSKFKKVSEDTYESIGSLLNEAVIIADNTNVNKNAPNNVTRTDKWIVQQWNTLKNWLIEVDDNIRGKSNERTKMNGGIVGYNPEAKGYNNDSRYSKTPSGYVDFSPIMNTVNAAKNSASGGGILGDKMIMKTIQKAIGYGHTQLGRPDEIKKATNDVFGGGPGSNADKDDTTFYNMKHQKISSEEHHRWLNER